MNTPSAKPANPGPDHPNHPKHPTDALDLTSLLRRHRWRVCAAVLLLLTTAIAGVALLGLSGGFLTATALAGALGVGSSFNFFSPSAGIRALTLVRIVSRYAEKLLGHATMLRIARDLRVWFFARALPLAPNQLGGQRMGDLLARVMSDIGELDGLLVRAWGPLLALGLLMGVAVFAAGCLFAPAAALLALLCVAIGWLLPRWAMRHAAAAELLRARQRAELRATAHEGLEGLADLTAMHAGADWAARVQSAASRVADGDRARRQRSLSAHGLHGAAASLGLVAMLALALWAQGAGRISAPHAAALVFITVGVLEVTAGMGLAWQALQAGRAALRRLREVSDQAPAVQDAAQPRAMPDAVRQASGESRESRESSESGGPCGLPSPAPAQMIDSGSTAATPSVDRRNVLELAGVVFGHAGQRSVLQGVDLRVGPGERVAIRGDSGAGKSTLSELVLRLWEPEAGRVSWCGVDLRELRQADWQSRIAWLPQGAPVFAGTVADNLRLGDPQASEAALWQVLRQVQLADWAAQAQGLATWVGENGATLSAGQARRLALARALLRQAPLMLLDEPTEGLDVDTAAAVMRDLAAALGPRSLIVITHAALPPGVVQRELWLRDGRLHER
jgi:ATP-binding cassette subfamily C protein CydC